MENEFELKEVRLEGAVPATFNIDKALKRNFKIECLRNNQTMSEVLNTLLQSYIIKSREMHAELLAKKTKSKKTQLAEEE